MKNKNQKGQALIELIIFLPLMFMFYSMIAGFANAINGSINQQKITRAYFYYRAQGNSTLPKPDDEKTYMGWKTFGMYIIGWKDYFAAGGVSPVAPCYELKLPMGRGPGDKCEDAYREATTQLIRVQTVYGVCGATYERFDSTVLPIPDFIGADFKMLISREGCLLN